MNLSHPFNWHAGSAVNRGVPITIRTSNPIIAANTSLPKRPPNMSLTANKSLATGLYIFNANDLGSNTTFQSDGFVSVFNAKNHAGEYLFVGDIPHNDQIRIYNFQLITPDNNGCNHENFDH